MELSCTSISLVTHPPSNPKIQSETPIWKKNVWKPPKRLAVVEDLESVEDWVVEEEVEAMEGTLRNEKKQIDVVYTIHFILYLWWDVFIVYTTEQWHT